MTSRLSLPVTWKIWIGTSNASAMAMARPTASASTRIGRDQAWYLGAVRPALTRALR